MIDIRQAMSWDSKPQKKPIDFPLRFKTVRYIETNMGIGMREQIEMAQRGTNWNWNLLGEEVARRRMIEEQERVVFSSGERTNISEEDICREKGVLFPTKYALGVEVLNKSSSYGDTRSFWYGNNLGRIMTMTQTPFPHCCGLCILHNFSFDNTVTQEMFNNFINDVVKCLIDNDRFSKILIYTTIQAGIQHKLFRDYPKIVILDTFLNPRTDRVISGFEIEIQK